MADEKKRIGATSLPKGTQSNSFLADMIRDENASLDKIVETMDLDYQVTLAFRVLSSNCNQVEVSFNIEDFDGITEEDRERLKVLSGKMSSLFESSRKSMMEFIKYGRVAYEKVWDYDQKSSLSFVKKLEPLPYKQTKMLIWKKGESFNGEEIPDSMIGTFKGIELKSGGDVVEFMPPKAWWLALNPTALEPHGRSMYASAPYQVWKDRDKARKLRSTYLRRFSLGGATIYGPPTVIDEETNEVINAHEIVATEYHKLQDGGAMIFDNARDDSGNYEWEFNDQGIQQKSETPLTSILSMMDSEQLLAFGIPPKTVIEGDSVGSFALVSQQMLILYSVVEDIIDDQIGSFQKYIVNKQVERNVRIPNGEQAIVATYERLTDRPDDLAVELVKSWLLSSQLSPILLSGAVDIAAIMERVGISLSDDAENKIKLMIEKAKTAAETAAVQPSSFEFGQELTAAELATKQREDEIDLVPFPKRAV